VYQRYSKSPSQGHIFDRRILQPQQGGLPEVVKARVEKEMEKRTFIH
jgi:hypothetical protein